MNNTAGLEPNESANGVDGWSDVQIFELAAGGADWQLPLDVDLSTAVDPPPAVPSAPSGYRLARHTLIAAEEPDITATKAYPALHVRPSRRRRAPTSAGMSPTWATRSRSRRWSPLRTCTRCTCISSTCGHPSHGTGRGGARRVPARARRPAHARRRGASDTVRVESNQLLELLVYFPPGYGGDHVYQCHLVEHEDNCMMSHFHVSA